MSSFVNVRVFFSKTGNAKYISHLDLYRAFGRAIKRSALPVWITEGFNPHIYMTFALPLALGIEGAEESVDLRLTDVSDASELDFNDIARTLNSVMPQGLDVIRAAVPVRKANQIQRARYRIGVGESGTAVLDEYFSQREIVITKKTKKNIQTIDVKPLLEWSESVLTLPAGSVLSINPWNVLGNVSVGSVRREAILCDDGGLFL